jgi:phenylalanyl-tRNA synthetase beta chain
MVCVGPNDTRQIVCGTKKFKLNDHVPVALPQTVLPGDFKISKSHLRGIDSEGMMCSGKEFGLGEDYSGLLILERNIHVGTCLHDAIAVNWDTIFNLSLTTNLGDSLSHIGIARDLAARLHMALELPQTHGIEVVEKERPEGHFLKRFPLKPTNADAVQPLA